MLSECFLLLFPRPGLPSFLSDAERYGETIVEINCGINWGIYDVVGCETDISRVAVTKTFNDALSISQNRHGDSGVVWWTPVSGFLFVRDAQP